MAVCLNCGKEVKNKFCNVSCQDSYYAKLRIERYFNSPRTCSYCGRELDWKHRKNKYCNSSCAAKVNNRKIKRNFTTKQSYIDKISDDDFKQIVFNSKDLISSAKAFGYSKINRNIKENILNRCKSLGIEQKINSKKLVKNYTKKELFNNYKNWQSARSNIRKDAERTFRQSNKKLECYLCGYNSHIEIAHIKAVSKFSDDTLISEINDVHNLIALCPNHHWEFDHNKLTEADLNKINEYSAMDQ